MRFKSFMRRMVDSGVTELVQFDVTHYLDAGVGFSSYAGMPILEAFQLVNKWNAQQVNNQRYVYWLEA